MYSGDYKMYTGRYNGKTKMLQKRIKIIPIIESIKNKKSNKINHFMKIFKFINNNFVKKVSEMDKGFMVNDNCNGCGIYDVPHHITNGNGFTALKAAKVPFA